MAANRIDNPNQIDPFKSKQDLLGKQDFIKRKPKRRPKPTSPWRHKESHLPGMRVELSSIPGLTQKNIFPHHHPFWFQVPPMDPFTVTRGHQSQEYQTIYSGTFSISAGQKLSTVQFKTLFVEDSFGWELEPNFDIQTATRLLTDLSESGTPFLLHCYHRHDPTGTIRMPATLTDYIHTESEPYAYYSDVTFKHYRDPLVSTKQHGRSFPIRHKLTNKDTLHSLAMQYYGKPSLARFIARYNHIRTQHFSERIVKLGGKWKVGAIITIPAPPEQIDPARPGPIQDFASVSR